MKSGKFRSSSGSGFFASLLTSLVLFSHFAVRIFGQNSPTDPKSAPTPKPDNNPHPAAVRLQNGTLTVDADDSNLAQILRDLSRESGMIIEGSVSETRIYGKYGPQEPHAVLSDLLKGLGYNVMMVGGNPGEVPHRLVLTGRTGGPSTSISAAAPSADPAQSTPQTTQTATPNPQETQLGPGAISHPPPPPSDDPQERAQQNLQRLQRMHQDQGNATH